MITPEQVTVLRTVLKRFIQDETPDWTTFDDNMCHLQYLTDNELIIEAQIALDYHKQHNARCLDNHTTNQCFVPVVLDAIRFIVSDFSETNRLAKSSRYIVETYLSLDAIGAILTDD